jgi:hypothetical protein
MSAASMSSSIGCWTAKTAHRAGRPGPGDLLRRRIRPVTVPPGTRGDRDRAGGSNWRKNSKQEDKEDGLALPVPFVILLAGLPFVLAVRGPLEVLHRVSAAFR